MVCSTNMIINIFKIFRSLTDKKYLKYLKLIFGHFNFATKFNSYQVYSLNQMSESVMLDSTISVLKEFNQLSLYERVVIEL